MEQNFPGKKVKVEKLLFWLFLNMFWLTLRHLQAYGFAINTHTEAALAPPESIKHWT